MHGNPEHCGTSVQSTQSKKGMGSYTEDICARHMHVHNAHMQYQAQSQLHTQVYMQSAD